VLGFAYDRALSVRAELAQGALQQFEGSPWLGSSFVELAQRIYPHNILVEILMTNGIVGFVLLAVLLVFVVKALLRLLQTPFAWLGLLCLQYLTASMSSGSLYFDATFWLLPMAVLGADWTNRHFGQSRSGGIAPR
jgi:O-antigen ligase